jgi:hypothetical protein
LLSSSLLAAIRSQAIDDEFGAFCRLPWTL